MNQSELAPRPLLEVQVDRKQYAGRVVLDNFTLALQRGEVVSLVGPSGCGKSTLLRIIAGLDTRFQGQINLDGARQHGPSPRIGVMFQEPRLLPWLSVAANVGFAAGRHAAQHPRALELLAEVGLAEVAHAWSRALSGGMAQRVALARSLFCEPDLLLLDEPFSAVDAITRMRLQALLLNLAHRHNTAALLVTHDLDEALYLSDRVILMAPGATETAYQITVTQAHPRDRADPQLAELRTALLKRLAYDAPQAA